MLNNILTILISQDFLGASIRLATPLLIATMGGIFSERSGVLFLGLEGFMLIGAFFGFVGAYFFGPAGGLLLGVSVAMLVGMIFAFCTVTLSVNQVVVSVAINIFAMGVTSAFFRTIFGTSTSQIESARITVWKIPFLSDIPYLGAFFTQTPFAYLGYILVPLVFFIFYKTEWGLKIRAVGENPKAAETMGVNVTKIRYISILWASAFAAIAGASQTVGDLGLFVDNMIAGKGFIAFAAIILGRFTPIGTMLTVFFFGIVDALQLNLQATGSTIPYQFPLMMPYILTLIAFLIAGSGVSPKGWGSPYIKEE